MYEKWVSRLHPGCVIFLLDQSASMNGPLAGDPAVKKAVAAANIVNESIYELCILCRKSLERTYHYFDLGIIGYGAHGAGPGWAEGRGDHCLVPVTDVVSHPARIEERVEAITDANGKKVEGPRQYPVWVNPVAGGPAPMAQAMARAGECAYDWAESHPNSFPPIVFLITGGAAEPASFADAGTLKWAERLKGITTMDGGLLLYIVYLSDVATSPVLFPASRYGLPNDTAATLFGMSGKIPEHSRDALAARGHFMESDARGFAMNADISPLIRVLFPETGIG